MEGQKSFQIVGLAILALVGPLLAACTGSGAGTGAIMGGGDRGDGGGQDPPPQIVYEVGQEGPSGGLVFYDDEADGTDDIPGARYLEAAPSDLADDGGTDEFAWGPQSANIGDNDPATPPHLTAIGTGAANTAAIRGDLGGAGGFAAQLAAAYGGGGHTDWFLPSVGELAEMRQAIGSSAGFQDAYYWSSTEATEPHGGRYTCAALSFPSGAEAKPFYKNVTHRVRPIRAF